MNGVERQDAAPARPSQSPDTVSVTSSAPLDLCPFLATADGNWRSSSAVREHRCIAMTPPVPLALEKQRRLCLVADHATCATYEAAAAARQPSARRTESGLRTIARTTPVILDHGRFDLRLPAFRPDRISGQGLLVGLLGLAFAAILIARPAGDGRADDSAGGINAAASPGPTTVGVASAEPAPSAPASEAPVLTARPIASGVPTASSQPTSAPASAQPAGSGATYKVRSGDTLSAIAARYKTTVKVLADLNKITDPSKLKIGQVLRLP
jgi:LysM repeat protein